jgi:hypothetical protein
VRHTGGASAHYLLARAIREFHRSAYRYFQKHSQPAVRLLSPLVYAGLMLRAELRLRLALRRTKIRPSAPVPVAAAHSHPALAPVATGLEPKRSQ